LFRGYDADSDGDLTVHPVSLCPGDRPPFGRKHGRCFERVLKPAVHHKGVHEQPHEVSVLTYIGSGMVLKGILSWIALSSHLLPHGKQPKPLFLHSCVGQLRDHGSWSITRSKAVEPARAALHEEEVGSALVQWQAL